MDEINERLIIFVSVVNDVELVDKILNLIQLFTTRKSNMPVISNIDFHFKHDILNIINITKTAMCVIFYMS